MSIIWIVLGICVAYDITKVLVYIGSKRLTKYLEQKRTERLKAEIKRHLENQQ